MTLILSGTDGLSDVDGSAATPAIRGTDANTGIFFPAADVIAFSEGGVESARFNSSGNLQTIGTISVGNATPSTSGAGITFPATQSASSNANTLDDYEEGTFTPAFAYSAINPTVSYSEQNGRYTKIGNIVRFHISIQWSGLSGGSGNVGVTLPFAVSSVDSFQGAFMTPYSSGITPIVCGTAYADFATSRYIMRNASTNNTLISSADVQSAGHLIHSGIYMVA
jgi:hypothetical protein